MPVFHYAFDLPDSVQAVSAFHKDTYALRRLTPPPVVVQMQRVEPLAEGSISEFTMWFGPFPVRWVARHTQVDPLYGFTDTQVRGPLRCWQHTHRFIPTAADRTRVEERIEYQYRPGFKGWWTRLIFSPLALRFMFSYRAWVTRRGVRSRS